MMKIGVTFQNLQQTNIQTANCLGTHHKTHLILRPRIAKCSLGADASCRSRRSRVHKLLRTSSPRHDATALHESLPNNSELLNLGAWGASHFFRDSSISPLYLGRLLRGARTAQCGAAPYIMISQLMVNYPRYLGIL
jgi:hypothetical protein